MSARGHLRAALAALIALLVGALGANECVPPTDATTSPPPAASLHLVTMTPYWLSGGAWYAVARIQVNASAPLQAYDLDVTWTPGAASEIYPFAHPSFSDDNNTFASVSPPNLPAGRIVHLLDLRHGPNSAMGGLVDIAFVVLRVTSPTSIWLQVDGKFARPDGTLFATTPSARLRLMPPK